MNTYNTLGTPESVLIKEVSLFQSALIIERLHCSLLIISLVIHIIFACPYDIRNPSVHEELDYFTASCLKCTRKMSAHFEQRPFTLSPPGSSVLACRREHKAPSGDHDTSLSTLSDFHN